MVGQGVVVVSTVGVANDPAMMLPRWMVMVWSQPVVLLILQSVDLTVPVASTRRHLLSDDGRMGMVARLVSLLSKTQLHLLWL